MARRPLGPRIAGARRVKRPVMRRERVARAGSAASGARASGAPAWSVARVLDPRRRRRAVRMSLASSKVRLRSASGRSAGTPRRSASPDGALAERWVTVDGIEVYHRESAAPVNGPVMTHLHGFGLSGRYLLPTAEALAGDFHTLVPDLPGFGRSGNPATPLGIVGLAHAAAAFLDATGIARATLV